MGLKVIANGVSAFFTKNLHSQTTVGQSLYLVGLFITYIEFGGIKKEKIYRWHYLGSSYTTYIISCATCRQPVHK